MEIVFLDERLVWLFTDRPEQSGVPPTLIQSLRRKLHFIKNAPDERTLREWKSLHYEKLKGDRAGQRSIRLNDRMRLVFEIDDQSRPPKARIHGVEDYH